MILRSLTDDEICPHPRIKSGQALALFHRDGRGNLWTDLALARRSVLFLDLDAEGDEDELSCSQNRMNVA